MANRALLDQRDRTVKVNRERLVHQLKANKEKHQIEYDEAVSGYRETALAHLEKAQEKAKASLERSIKATKSMIEDFSPETADQYRDHLTLIESVSVHLMVPRNYVKEYEAAIDMFEWESSDEVELSAAEFQCFVRDIWSWSQEFEAVKMSYVPERG